MTVSEFIESLKECDPDAQVLVSRDAEGNGYCRLDDVYTGYFLDKSEYEKSGRYDDVRTYGVDDDENEYDKQPDQLKPGKHVVCVVIYPV